MVSKKQTESKARSTYSKLNTPKARLEDYHHPATIAGTCRIMWNAISGRFSVISIH